MMRVLVIGDSHAGAYKAGWPTIAERYPDVTVDVFAVPFPHFKSPCTFPAVTMNCQ